MARLLEFTLNGRPRLDAVADNLLLLDYLREQGAGSGLLGVQGQRNFRLASIITLIALMPAGAALAIRGIVTAIIMIWIFRLFYFRWLGGITGDLIGAGAEVVEALVFVAVT